MKDPCALSSNASGARCPCADHFKCKSQCPTSSAEARYLYSPRLRAMNLKVMTHACLLLHLARNNREEECNAIVRTHTTNLPSWLRCSLVSSTVPHNHLARTMSHRWSIVSLGDAQQVCMATVGDQRSRVNHKPISMQATMHCVPQDTIQARALSARAGSMVFGNDGLPTLSGH